MYVLIKPSLFVLLTTHMIWNRKTEAEACVVLGRSAAQKAIDQTTADFAGWSATERGSGMGLAAARKAMTAALCRNFSSFFLRRGGFEGGREKTSDEAHKVPEVRKAADRDKRREGRSWKKGGEKPPAKGPVSGGTRSRSAVGGGSREEANIIASIA
jgi:hypothetical protein